MQQQHKSLLVSTYTTVLQHLAEVRQIVAEGKTPAGGRVRPLPQPLRDRLLENLDALAAGLEGLLQRCVPEWQQEAQETGGLAATRMWVAILLRTIEELLWGILPEQMSRRYGAVKDAEGDQIRRQVDTALATLREAMLLASEAASHE